MMTKTDETKMIETKGIDLELQEGANHGHPHHGEGLQAGERGKEATLIHQDIKLKVQALLQFLRKERQKFKNLSPL